MATKNARKTTAKTEENTEATETTTAVAVEEAPAAPSLELTVEFDMSEFHAAVAGLNRELAAKIKTFKDENADKLSAAQKAQLAGLARGYSRIANDLTKSENAN